MGLVVPNTSENALVDMLLQETDENYSLKLFKNDATVNADTVIGDLTEADFTGYSAKTLTKTSWGSASQEGGKARSTYAQQEWENTGGTSQTVYGYYITRATGGGLLWVEKFAVERTLQQGDKLQLTPAFELESAN